MVNHFARALHEAFILLPAFLAVFTMRGFSKALMARLSGDRTAASEGFISLNPLAHIDLYGLLFFIGFIGITAFLPDAIRLTVLFSVLMIAGVRWTFEVPIDESQFHYYRTGMVATTLAGPLGNFMLALVGLYLFKYVPFTTMAPNMAMPLVQIVQNIVEFSLFFGVLDLVPLPPFEAGRLLPVLLPSSMQDGVRTLQSYAPFIFLALFILPGLREVFFYGLHTGSNLIRSVLEHLVF